MARNDKNNEETIFDAAIKLQSGPQRDAYLAQACGNDSKLRGEVEALIRAHEAKSLLDEPAFDLGVTIDRSPITEGPGTVIGHFKLLEKVGEGGMASVYMAEQKEPIRRKVALKIIKLGMDTREVIARFEVERQALAMMDHPNIAKVFDAGATDTGRPYFVMELVKGVSITEYCDKNKISTKERLDLFIQVCNAVQHAHQKGIIHRDMKPSNVMVTQRDGKAVPKVIDFGIAKATSQKLTEKTLFTRYAHIIGTPAYMSPEQAELSELDVDTRTDIYSLGVLLYELLTGTTPVSEEELRKAGLVEVQRMIREDEPVKPSTKLTTLGERLIDVAEHRKATPDSLRKLVRGDLDWIVMRSLEKDRRRRYDTVAELAADIKRHLRCEPVLAAAPTLSYKARKFVQRHRVGVITVALVMGALIAGAAAATVGFVHANVQRRRAVSNFERACAAVDEMMRLAQRSVYEVPTIKSGALLQQDIVLKAQEFYQGLSKTNKNIPILRVKLAGTYQVVGESCLILRDYEQAEQAYRRAVGIFEELMREFPEDAELPSNCAYCQNGLGLSLDGLGQDEEAQSAYRSSLDMLRPVANTFSFGTPKELGPVVNSRFVDCGPCISYDGLSLFFYSNRPGGFGRSDIWVTERATTQDHWSTPVNLGPTINSKSYDAAPTITADGLMLFFESARSGGCGGSDLWVITRQTTDGAWSEPANIGPNVNGPDLDGAPSISADGLSLFFLSDRPGGAGNWDLWWTSRQAVGDPWDTPVNLGAIVNSPYLDQTPSISPDGLMLFFSSKRPGGLGYMGDIWMARRETVSDTFGKPVFLSPPLNSAACEVCPNISADGATIYFATYARPSGAGNWDLWEVPVLKLQPDSAEELNSSTLGEPAEE
ncbi:MAG: serine/threonine-protein kinase [Sedimentisphaerales bacterium]|nr:serine/threonine-protein kinase [Sedimentisphaerales bacterium]